MNHPEIYIIAEAGVNHNGSLETALRLCDAAKESGADAVKFQTWQTDKFIGKDTTMADYQIANTGAHAKTQYEMLRELEMSYDSFAAICRHCKEIGIDFLSTPEEDWSLRFLVDDLNLPLVKLGSGDVTNIPFLRAVGRCRKPVILSTGMSTMAEVATALDTLRQSGAPEVTLLHCTTNYPCPFPEVNLSAMTTLREAFHCPTGYSDHTLGIAIPIAAAALGATVIEKHFTLDKKMPGPDHLASLEPDELRAMVTAIREVEAARGDGIKRPNPSEMKIAAVVRKKITAARHIAAGEIMTADALSVRRLGEGITAAAWDFVVGLPAPRDFNPDDAISLQ